MAANLTTIDNAFCYPGSPAPADGAPTALVLLNCEGEAAPRLSPLLRCLWRAADVRLCADGAASRLFHGLVSGALAYAAPGAAPLGGEADARALAALRAFLPDEVVGDWDSIDARAEAFYRGAGVAMHAQPEDQDSTDLEKCLARLVARQAAAATAAAAAPPRMRVIVAGSFGGRLDHTVQNLNCLYKWSHCFGALVMVTEHSAARLLPAGASEVRVAAPFEGPTCGLLPLAGATELTTQGLQWDVSAALSEFGGMVSTSNCALGAAVSVRASRPTIWTVNINPAAFAAAAAALPATA